MIPASPRCPKTWSVVLALLRARGYVIPPGAWQIPRLNMPKADLPALTEVIGPGWSFTVQHLAYDRVKVTITPPMFCGARPVRKPCEAEPRSSTSLLSTLAMVGALAAGIAPRRR
jgi:hypothetical protein